MVLRVPLGSIRSSLGDPFKGCFTRPFEGSLKGLYEKVPFKVL